MGAALTAPALAAFPGQNGKIAFVTGRDGGDTDVYVMNADGSAETPLTSNTTSDLSPAWSPDGTKIAFASDRDGGTYDYDVYVMNADGSGQTRLTTAGGGEPAWSPDGTKIAFVRSGDIWVMSADGTNQVPLITASVFDASPAWSPNGSQIAFERYLSGCCPFTQIYVANAADGSAQTSLTPENPDEPGFVGENIDPSWSPAGGVIAFAHDSCEGSCDPKPAFVTYYVSPGAPGQYASGAGGREPAWSPDGTKIAFNLCYFTLFAECDGVDIGVMSYPSSQGSNLTDDRRSTSPDWQTIPFSGYARPKGATPLRVPLVPAFAACTAPNRTHGPPLAFGSCNPPGPESAELTVGSAPASMSGFVRYSTIVGNPATQEDEADLALRVEISDVRVQGSLGDYAGEVEAQSSTRMTDRTGSGGDPATATDVRFPLTTPCTPTADTAVGSSCSLTTTLDTLIPGAVVERQRTILQLGQVRMVDGGPDGDTATEPNTVFLRQGLFVP